MIQTLKRTLIVLALTVAGAPAPSLAAEPQMITKPDWLRRPNANDILAYIPALNDKNRRGGRALIECAVDERGLLQNCSVKSEYPEGSGFGQAALSMSRSFQMKPKTVDGKPVLGTVRVPLIFGPLDTNVDPGDQPIRMLTNAPWSQTPTPQQVAAAFPSALKNQARGHVVLRCRLPSDGRPTGCKTISIEPSGFGLEKAALSLAPYFRAEIAGDPAAWPNDINVSIPIDFPNPNQQHPPLRILDPIWLKLPSLDEVEAAFPRKAAEAKVLTGRAMLDCAVDHAGGLTDCVSSEETPADLGFGEATQRLVGTIRVNPWTTSGYPTDGARIKFPLRLNHPDAAAD